MSETMVMIGREPFVTRRLRVRWSTYTAAEIATEWTKELATELCKVLELEEDVECSREEAQARIESGWR